MKKYFMILVAIIGFGMSVSAQADCSRCNGTGKDPLTYPCKYCTNGQVEKLETNSCSMCSGSGRVTSSSGVEQNCPSCSGSGRKYVNKMVTCSSCGGSGEERRSCRSCGGTGKSK